MPQHEVKVCPRCHAQFECKIGSINLCQCQVVSLNTNEADYIRKQFEDCLCADCLVALKKEYQQQLFEEKINRAYRYFNLKPPFKNE
jgi:hypothetical protein